MPAPTETATRVLVVDDTSLVRAALRRILREGGYEVVGEMSSGQDFWPTVMRLMPDIICLDQQMPGRDGMALLSDVQRMAGDIAVVMITGSDDPELEAAAVAAGLTCFIRKPFSPAKIIFELKQVEHARKLLKKSKAFKGSPIVGLRAIIAEDSAILRKLLTVILNSIGVEVVGEASNGQEVLDLADQHDVEVILMDLKMPVMGGLEALVKIKETHPTIRVIIVSGNTEAQMVRDAISLGASGYLVKPFDRDKVIEVMSNLMF